MNIADLEKKVKAAEAKVEKCKATIERHKKQMEKKGDALRKMGIDPEAPDKYEPFRNGSNTNREAYWLLSDYDDKKDDVKGAEQKLADAERICANWNEKLDVEINKEKIIQDTVPQVIKDFLEKWKDDAFDWYLHRYDGFLELRARLRNEEHAARLEAYNTLPEYVDTRERYKSFLGDKDPDYSTLLNLYPSKPVNEFLKERKLDYKAVQERLNNYGDGIIFKMLDYRDKDERCAWLNKTLEEEKKAKLIFLINSITYITGPITDAKHLYVSAGDLNGVIVGEKGVAKIQTFSAGGYNIQCFHYRTRVDDVTEKYKEDPSVFINNNNDARICIYQFPRFEGGDGDVAKDYGLEVVVTNNRDTVVKGQYRDILAFADNYLGYQLVPEYLKEVDEEKPGLDSVINSCAAKVKDETGTVDKQVELAK